MAIKDFAQLMEAARAKGPKSVAIVAAQEHEVLLAAQDAEQQGLAECILVGDRAVIENLAGQDQLDIRRMMIIHEPNPKEAARKVMQMVGQGHADLAMKGQIETGDFLRAALNREMGLRTNRLFSHVAVFEIPGFERLIFVSDSGVVVAPTMEQKVELVRNAIEVALKLGIKEPKVAVLAATEMINPKIPTTIDAANLSKMADRGQITGGLVDGPLALDNAISLEAAEVKGIHSTVAGRADILITPDIEAGNMLSKAIIHFAKGRMAGVVVGARSPLIVTSRSDPHESKLISIALGILLAP